MTHETLIVARDGPLLKIELNRPEARNALSPVMVREHGTFGYLDASIGTPQLNALLDSAALKR